MIQRLSTSTSLMATIMATALITASCVPWPAKQPLPDQAQNGSGVQGNDIGALLSYAVDTATSGHGRIDQGTAAVAHESGQSSTVAAPVPPSFGLDAQAPSYEKIRRALFLTRPGASVRERRIGTRIAASQMHTSLPKEIKSLLKLQVLHSEALLSAHESATSLHTSKLITQNQKQVSPQISLNGLAHRPWASASPGPRQRGGLTVTGHRQIPTKSRLKSGEQETQRLQRIIYQLSAQLKNTNDKLRQLAEIDQAIQEPNTPAVK